MLKFELSTALQNSRRMQAENIYIYIYMAVPTHIGTYSITIEYTP